jgi:hypothetical protein
VEDPKSSIVHFLQQPVGSPGAAVSVLQAHVRNLEHAVNQRGIFYLRGQMAGAVRFTLFVAGIGLSGITALHWLPNEPGRHFLRITLGIVCGVLIGVAVLSWLVSYRQLQRLIVDDIALQLED